MDVSIKDVARAAGVSPTTVSHVLSGKRPVSAELTARVRVAMAEMGYAPMRSARNLALGRTQLIGLLVPDIGNTFFAELTKGVERVASGNQYNVIIANTGFDRDRALMHMELIRSRAVDGVVYSAGSPFTDTEIAQAIGGLPLVLVDEEVPGSASAVIVSDNRDGGRAVAEHLLGLGHRDVLVLKATNGLQTSVQRVDGFLDAWRAGGGGIVRIADGGFTAEGGQLATSAFVGDIADGALTAVFAVNDEMALGALRELRSHGIEVPRQVSLVGFDDIRSARDAMPPLTTVRQDVAELGERAAEVLLAILATGEQPAHPRVTLPVHLVVRDSTGAPAPRRVSRRGSGEQVPAGSSRAGLDGAGGATDD